MILGILIIGGLLIAAGLHFSNIVIYPNVSTPEAMREKEIENENFDAAAFDAWERETITLTSPHGHQLFGLYFPIVDSHKTVIVVHGITNNHYGSVKYAQVFRRLGFNLLLVDLRYHGNSGGDFSSFGYYEKYDLQVWMDWVVTRCKQDAPDAAWLIGTHGESLGGAAVLQHAAIDPRLDFVVADCPFARLTDELTYRLKVEYHLPPFPLLPLASAITKLRCGFAFEDVAPVEMITKVKIPILFIHGEADAYIPFEASVRLHAAKSDPKMLHLIPDVQHACALSSDRDKYAQTIEKFLVDMVYTSN